MTGGRADALVPITKSDLDLAADPAQYVVQACERAKAWLADALEHGDIEQIVELKSQAEAIRVYTAQKQLGKDAELSAAEIVRRAERGIGLAIRKGQEDGDIATPSDTKSYAGLVRQHKGKTLVLRPTLPSDLVTQDELTGNGAGIYHLTDNVSDEQFEAAIDEGTAEGNLSRANVVRKVRAKREARRAHVATVADKDGWIPDTKDRRPKAASRRRELLRDLAGKAWTSRQIGQRLGILPATIREIAQKEGITIPADTVVGLRTRTAVDSNRIVRETVNSVEGLEIALDLVRFDELDRTEIKNWITSLTTSIRVLNRLNKQLKEMIQ